MRPETKTWAPLSPGSKVTIINTGLALGMEFTTDEIAEYREVVEGQWGLDLTHETLEQLGQEDYYAWSGGSPQHKADNIIRILNDPEIRAVFDCGGNNSAAVVEILARYDKEHGLPKRPDLALIGTSDAEVLHNFLGQRGVVTPIVGRIPYRINPGESEIAKEVKSTFNRQLGELLCEHKVPDTQIIPVNRASAEAAEIDGKSVVYCPFMTRSEHRVVSGPDYPAIMLVEFCHTTKRDFKKGWDNAISGLKRQADGGEMPKAIIISRADGGCFDDADLESTDLTEIKDAVKDCNIPVFFGTPYGHGHRRRLPQFQPIPLHTDTRIRTGEDGKVIMEIDPVRSREDIDEVTAVLDGRKPYVPKVMPSAPEGKRLTSPLKLIHVNPPEGEVESKSFVDRFAGGQRAQMEFFMGEQLKIFSENCALNLDGVDLSAQDNAIAIEGLLSFEKWQSDKHQEHPRTTQGRPVLAVHDRTQDKWQEYLAENLQHMVQPTIEALLELQKTGELDRAKSITLLAGGVIPDGFHDWLRDFTKTYGYEQPFYVARLEEEMKAELFPDRGEDEPPGLNPAFNVQARVQIKKLEDYKGHMAEMGEGRV